MSNLNMEDWNEICFLLSENIKSDISENSFEKNVVQALRVLGWKQFAGDFDIRPSFQIGASNRITPDFVIKSADNHKLFVIEIKQPSIPFTPTFQQQLFSYMRQLKLEYGILIGQGIQIFYDGNLTEQEDPILLETIRFEKDSKKGENFVHLFRKESFNSELLKDFTLSAIEKLNRKEEYKKLKSITLSGGFTSKLTELIKQHFISEYDGEIIDNVLSEIKIEITEKSLPIPSVETFTKKVDSATDFVTNSTRDYSRYLYNGQTYGKNRLVLAVIKDFVRKNPALSYNQLKEKFPDKLQGSETFTTEKNAKQKKDRRNFIKPNELVVLTDEVIAVSTEWGLFNITHFISHCIEMDIEIRKV